MTGAANLPKSPSTIWVAIAQPASMTEVPKRRVEERSSYSYWLAEPVQLIGSRPHLVQIALSAFGRPRPD